MRREKGFTLMELLVSMVVLATLATAIIALNGGLFNRDSDIRNLQSGAELLQACSETVLSTRRSSSTKFNTNFSAICSDLGGNGFKAPVVTVTTTPPSSGTNDACPTGESCKWAVISIQKSGSLVDAMLPVTVRLMDY